MTNIHTVRRQLALRAVSLTSLLIFLIFLVIRLFASYSWFARNDRVSAGGMSVSVCGNIYFGDEITVVRTLGTTTDTSVYRCEGNSEAYFRYAEGAFSLDGEGNRIPLRLTALFPGETVDITVTMTCDERYSDGGYRLYFSDLDDTENGTFVTANGETYSVFGIYHITCGDTDKDFIASYTGDHSLPDKFEITTGMWGGETSASVTFRITVDLSQYTALEGTASNQLSEKYVSIGTLGLEEIE